MKTFLILFFLITYTLSIDYLLEDTGCSTEGEYTTTEISEDSCQGRSLSAAQDGYECVIIPGVTSFCAVAASLQQSLTTMNEPLTILPGGMGELKQGLLTKGSKVIMKPAGAIGEIKNTLRELDLVKNTKAVCDCGLSTEKVYDNIEEIPENGQYFITMLVQDCDNKKNNRMEG